MERNLEPFLKGKAIDQSGNFSDVYQIENDPNYVAKVVDLTYEIALDHESKKVEFESNIKILKEHFAKYIPEFYFVYGESDEHDLGIPHVFMKKVIKENNIHQIDLINFITDLDEFMDAIIETYIETYNQGLGFKPDTRDGNILYGKTNNDRDSRLYFVDIYPIFQSNLDNIKRTISLLVDPIKTYGRVTINGVDHYLDEGNKPEEYFPKTKSALMKLEQLK